MANVFCCVPHAPVPAGVEPSVLEPFKLDTAALTKAGCSMQLVLLPYGDAKQSRGYSK
jgi:hypothetical protein